MSPGTWFSYMTRSNLRGDTRNENMSCSFCGEPELIVREEQSAALTPDYSYKCEDCGAWYTVDDGGIDEFKTEPTVDTEPKTPMDMDREVGAAPRRD